MTHPSPVELIARKRDGGTLSAGEIRSLVDGFVNGRVADYQMSAWLMAAFMRGLGDDETVALTDAMLHSGKVLRLPSIQAAKIDKHSTGGVGDKVSLCLAPLVAACGVAVPMVSGRGLGHTGGTLDKLEAIAGYRVHLTPKRFERVVRDVGTSIIGQTAEIAPADRRIYALRDVTGTVECIPLIVASILSKKLAAGLDGLVLDVKCGSGAFMKDRSSARDLARALVRVARGAGLPAVALLTDMSTPLGMSIGNAMEAAEAIEVLQGAGPSDTRELTVALGAEMLRLAGVVRRTPDARARLCRALDNGEALDRFARMVHAHGGDARVAEDVRRLPRAPHRVPVTATTAGFVHAVDALGLGLMSMRLGAGRTRADQKVDPRVGIELLRKPGDRVARGEPLAWLHVRRPAQAKPHVDGVRKLFVVRRARSKPRPLVLERVR